MLLVGAAAMASFSLLAADVADDRGWVVELDQEVAVSVHDVFDDRPAAVNLAQAVTVLGNTVTLYAVATAVVLLALARHRIRLAVFVVAAVPLGALLNHVLKIVVDRDRPRFDDPVEVGNGPSFPSGHAMNSLITYASVVVVVCVISRRRAVPAAVGAALVVAAIGFTRVALGVHYVSDVLSGWLAGTAWLAIAILALRPSRSAPVESAGPIVTASRRAGY